MLGETGVPTSWDVELGDAVTGLETAAAAVAQRAGREWLAARGEGEQRRELSDLIRVSFSDRFVQRRLERQLADIADLVERRLAALISVGYRGLPDNDRAVVFAELTAALERATRCEARVQ